MVSANPLKLISHDNCHICCHVWSVNTVIHDVKSWNRLQFTTCALYSSCTVVSFSAHVANISESSMRLSIPRAPSRKRLYRWCLVVGFTTEDRALRILTGRPMDAPTTRDRASLTRSATEPSAPEVRYLESLSRRGHWLCHWRHQPCVRNA